MPSCAWVRRWARQVGWAWALRRPPGGPPREPSSPPAGAAPLGPGSAPTTPAGSSLAIVGQNGAGKTTLAKLLCRLYDPQDGAIEADGLHLRRLAVAEGGRRRRAG